eukprot:4245798-Pleurochrysis_carterae.AAC.1
MSTRCIRHGATRATGAVVTDAFAQAIYCAFSALALRINYLEGSHKLLPSHVSWVKRLRSMSCGSGRNSGLLGFCPRGYGTCTGGHACMVFRLRTARWGMRARLRARFSARMPRRTWIAMPAAAGASTAARRTRLRHDNYTALATASPVQACEFCVAAEDCASGAK